MPIHLQTRLLRVLQEKEVMRLGGDSIIDVDVRILAATNRKLREQIREGTFRADLYYRLDVVPLRLPPLRERPEDIPALIHTFQKQLGVDYEFTEAAMRKLKSMYWEGNIRELRNCVEYFANWGKAQIGEEDLDVRYAGLEQALTDSAEKTAPAIPDAFLQFLLETRQEGRLAAEVLKALRLREERDVYKRQVVACLFVASFCLLLFGLTGIKIFTKIVEIPKEILMPMIIILSVIGSYAIRNSLYDIFWMFGFGLIGYFLKRNNYPVAPIILGVILTTLCENNYRRGVMLEGSIHGMLLSVFNSPISIVLFVLLIVLFVTQTGPYKKWSANRKKKAEV